MKIKEIHMKIIAIGLIPVFLHPRLCVAEHPRHSHPAGGHHAHRSCGSFHRNVNAEEGSDGNR